MSSSLICILIAIAVYLIGMLAIGAYYSKDQKTSGDFYLGGRKLGPVVTAMSTEASDMSGWLLMGLPGLAYFTGICDPGWTAIGLAVGTYFNWLLVAKRLRIYSTELDAITIPDFFAKRFHDNSGLIEGIAALIVIIFFVPYVASGFAACGKLFMNLFGASYMPTMIISAIVIVAYCAMGGFMAASITSLIQSFVMTFALVAILFYGINVAGGWDAVVDNARTVGGYLSLKSSGNVLTGEISPYGAITVLSTMAWGLGYFGMPHVLLHFMAVEDENKLKVSRRIGTVWVIISMTVAVLIGIIGYALANKGIIAGFDSSSAAEAIIVRISNLMASHGIIPALLAGVILAGILSSTMSTADAQLLAAASGISQNILQGVFHINLTDKQSMAIARITVIVIAVLGVFLARDPNSSVFMIVSFAWAGFGATFGPVMLFALFWKRTTRWGVLSGMVSGGIMIFVWKFLVRPLGGAWNIYELLPAFIVASFFIVVVSLITKKPDAAILREYDDVNARMKA